MNGACRMVALACGFPGGHTEKDGVVEGGLEISWWSPCTFVADGWFRLRLNRKWLIYWLKVVDLLADPRLIT